MSDVGIGAVERLIANAQAAAGNLKVRSALNPMLWLCAIVSLPSLTIGYFLRNEASFALLLFAVGSLPIVGAVIGFFYFMVTCPEKLQSEEYQIKHQALEIIKSKGSSIELIPSSLEAISNPAIQSRGEK